MWWSLWISCWFAALWWRMWGTLSVACLSHFRSLEKVLTRNLNESKAVSMLLMCWLGGRRIVVDQVVSSAASCLNADSSPSSSELSVCVDAGGWSAAPGLLHRPQSCWPRTQSAWSPSPSWLQGVWCSWDDVKLIVLCHDYLVEHNFSQTGHQSSEKHQRIWNRSS